MRSPSRGYIIPERRYKKLRFAKLRDGTKSVCLLVFSPARHPNNHWLTWYTAKQNKPVPCNFYSYSCADTYYLLLSQGRMLLKAFHSYSVKESSFSLFKQLLCPPWLMPLCIVENVVLTFHFKIQSNSVGRARLQSKMSYFTERSAEPSHSLTPCGALCVCVCGCVCGLCVCVYVCWVWVCIVYVFVCWTVSICITLYVRYIYSTSA